MGARSKAFGHIVLVLSGVAIAVLSEYLRGSCSDDTLNLCVVEVRGTSRCMGEIRKKT